MSGNRAESLNILANSSDGLESRKVEIEPGAGIRIDGATREVASRAYEILYREIGATIAI